MLKVACRDGPGEVQMVGFLSEQRVIAVDMGDLESATFLGIANAISTARRARAWRSPAPFESGLCVYINTVSAMTDGLPHGFRHIVRPAATPTNSRGQAYCHLNVRIDQMSPSNWDFRIFHWDAVWGWQWSECFAHALATAICDMAVAPMAPLLCIQGPPQWRQFATQQRQISSQQNSTWPQGEAGVRPTRKRQHPGESFNKEETAMEPVGADRLMAEPVAKALRSIGSAADAAAGPIVKSAALADTQLTGHQSHDID